MDVITFPVNLYTTSGLSIKLHDVISLPDATSCDKNPYFTPLMRRLVKEIACSERESVFMRYFSYTCKLHIAP